MTPEIESLTAAARRDERPSARPRAERVAVASSSPPVTRREFAWLVLGAFVLAVLTSWPLAAHLGSTTEPDLGDPIRTAWQIAVEGFQLRHHPSALFQTNAFWPHGDSLTFSDALLGYAPFGLVGSGVTAAVVRYNLLFLLCWTLPVVGAYLLSRELGVRPAAAAVAGVAFSYAPFRAAEAGHLHVLSSGGIPLALFALLRGYRRLSWRWVLGGWVIATWQLSLGFTLGLPFSYLLLALGLGCAVVWWRRGRPAPARGPLLASVLGVGMFVALGAFEARPYLHTAHVYADARRSLSLIKTYSASLKAFLAAPLENRVWGSATQSIRYSLSSQNESVLFPGLTIFLLALGGLGARAFGRRLRVGLAVGVAVFAVLSLGLDLLPGGWPYRFVYYALPGWDGVRVPGRIFSMAALGLALLAGLGADRLIGSARRFGRAPAFVGVLLAALVVFEGAGDEDHPVVPAAPPSTVSLAGPQLWLPTDDSTDRLFQLWSTDGFYEIANGVSTFNIPAQNDLRGGMQDFPDARGVAKLQRLGIRTVVLVPELQTLKLPPHEFQTAEPPHAVAAASKPIAGLPISRRRDGPLVIYTIHPRRAV